MPLLKLMPFLLICGMAAAQDMVPDTNDLAGPELVGEVLVPEAKQAVEQVAPLRAPSLPVLPGSVSRPLASAAIPDETDLGRNALSLPQMEQSLLMQTELGAAGPAPILGLPGGVSAQLALYRQAYQYRDAYLRTAEIGAGFPVLAALRVPNMPGCQGCIESILQEQARVPHSR